MHMEKWNEEPDSKEFESNGYKCAIKRTPHLKHLCGYVHIPKTHPLYGKDYGELYDMDVDISVHGGLTFAEQEGDEWVFGFDCAHFGDLVPSMHPQGFMSSGTYRDMDYVERETKDLAAQLKALETA